MIKDKIFSTKYCFLMPKKKKRTSISEIKRLDRRKNDYTKSEIYIEASVFWDLQRDILSELIDEYNELIDEYEESQEKWMADLDKFTNLWRLCIKEAWEAEDNNCNLEDLDYRNNNSKDLSDSLDIFTKAKQSLEKLLDKEKYHPYQKNLLKNSYMIVYLLSLEDWFMEKQGFLQSKVLSFKQKNIIQENSSNLRIWLLSYYTFSDDCIFEIPQFKWFLDKVSNIL